jgi:hypothetical protein
VTGHVADRLAGRIASGDRDVLEARVRAAVRACAKAGLRDVAVRVWRQAGKVACSDGSNGQVVVLIIRAGVPVTVFWRRVTQPHTAAAHGVRSVRCMQGTCTTGEHREHV